MMPALPRSEIRGEDPAPGTFTNVIGTRCLNTSYEGLIDLVAQWARREGTTAVDFTNTHIVTMRHDDPAFARSLEAFDYFVPDSQVLYFVIRLLGGRMPGRVYGPHFMAVAMPALSRPWRHYLLGGSEECLGRLRAHFAGAAPEADVVGAQSGYFGPQENERIIEEINRLNPDFVWVGLGTPKQQAWIAENRDRIRRGVLLAVGFAFDVNAGTKRDAPLLLQKLGLTWFYRLCSEPRRLWRRYLINNPRFIARVVLQTIGLRDYERRFAERLQGHG